MVQVLALHAPPMDSYTLRAVNAEHMFACVHHSNAASSLQQHVRNMQLTQPLPVARFCHVAVNPVQDVQATVRAASTHKAHMAGK